MPTAKASTKYLEVAAALEAQMRLGKWDGGKLPSVRAVKQQHRVSVVTASRALQVLRDKGLVHTVERSGCFRKAAPDADRWALVLRLTPGEWQKEMLSMTRLGFEILARRDPMHLDNDSFPLTAKMSERDITTLVRRAKESSVRGVFLLPSRYSEEEMRLDERFLACCAVEALPVVLLERNLRGHNRPLERDLVAVDDLDGAARCTWHLLDLGRKRVAIVVASPTSSHNDRVAGYLYALHAAAQRTVRKSVEYRPLVLSQSDDLPTRDAYARLADDVHRLGIDGIVCYQDYTAFGLILELLHRGMTVPDDVAVVGFDDLPIGNQYRIGVTTYSYPSEGMAEQAVRLMRERLKDPDRLPIKVVVPGQLIVRASSEVSKATK
jgi:LacI family transcriptional regulator